MRQFASANQHVFLGVAFFQGSLEPVGGFGAAAGPNFGSVRILIFGFGGAAGALGGLLVAAFETEFSSREFEQADELQAFLTGVCTNCIMFF